ncbi:UbiA family prenyltransferase [Streptomyces sp. NPDC050856]|uniref:UbiA family prenyltransferase n=1 Tax=Streptomyces sp. NPDC050856 TaxID=3154939 RepID=UPI0034107C84
MSSHSEPTVRPNRRRPLRILFLCLRESRVPVQVIFALRLLVAAALTGPADRNPLSRSVLLGLVSWSCAVFFVYLLNGVTDVEEDRVNGSKRPIASGALSTGEASFVARAAAVVALGCAALHGVTLLVPLALLLALGYGYSAPGVAWKRRTPTAVGVVLASGLLTYLAGHVVAQDSSGGRVRVVVFAVAMTAWMGLVGTLAKDFSDVEGDAAAGRRGVVVVRGARAARLLCGANALVVGGTFALCAALFAPELLLPALAVCLGALCLVATLAWWRGGRAPRRPYRVFMATQYSAHTTALVIASDFGAVA